MPDGRTIVQVGAARNEAEVKANIDRLRDQGLSSTEVYKR
ncbi:MAG: SPOR domain-containing protein [Stenomitos frigidus ULC029]